MMEKFDRDHQFEQKGAVGGRCGGFKLTVFRLTNDFVRDLNDVTLRCVSVAGDYDFYHK